MNVYIVWDLLPKSKSPMVFFGLFSTLWKATRKMKQLDKNFSLEPGHEFWVEMVAVDATEVLEKPASGKYSAECCHEERTTQ